MTIDSPVIADAHRRASARQYLQLIDGKLVEGAFRTPVIDPATEQIIAHAPVASDDQVDAAVEAAHRAFATWQHSTFEQRHEVLRQIVARIRARAEDIAEVITLEQGKSIIAARLDVELSIAWAEYYAGYEVAPKVVRDDADAIVTIESKPVGVVAAIVPWNFPFFQSIYKIAPALALGNTVVLKPAPTTPLNGMLIAEILADIVPAGVVNVVGDAGAVGPRLTEHPLVAKVSFTGSTAVGKAVMRSAADSLKRVTLELGGNDAAIVLPDADVAATAQGVFDIAFNCSGQVCINIKRVFVHESIYDAFAAEFARLAETATVGPGIDPANQFGPLQNSRQYANAKRLLAVAKKDGRILTGGEVPEGPGYFIPLTVVTDIDDSSELVVNETFAPIRSLLRYSDVDDVVARANSSIYGLGASVWGADVDAATKIAQRLIAGTTWVNQHFVLTPDVPFGGAKESGIGSEFGDQGTEGLTRVQVVNVKRSQHLTV
jgi:aldehyde dehydrogenase (NAD+)